MRRTTRPGGLSAFYHDLAKNQSLWTAVDRSGHPAIVDGRGPVPVRPFWSSEARAWKLMELAPGYEDYQPLEIPWSEFVERVIPELEAAGMLAGIDWTGQESLGCDLRPMQVFQGVEGVMARLSPREADLARTRSRAALARDLSLGGALGGVYGFVLASEFVQKYGVRSLAVLLISPLAGMMLALELRSKRAWESRGLAWSFARYILSFASTAGLVYSLGAWLLYPWSWKGLLATSLGAVYVGFMFRLALAHQRRWSARRRGTDHAAPRRKRRRRRH